MRAAYRALARRLHPDTLADATPAERALADRRMREVTEAFHVVGDPARRRRYDDERLSAAGRSPSAATARAASRPTSTRARAAVADPAGEDDGLVEVMPHLGALGTATYRHLPWVVLVVVLVGIFVVTAYAGHGDAPSTTGPPPAVAVGSCLDVHNGPSTTVVSCSGPHDVELVARAASARDCPPGTEARRLAADGLLDCVTPG